MRRRTDTEVSQSSTDQRAQSWRADRHAFAAVASTLPLQEAAALAVHADNGFSKTLPASGLPGYDAAENDRPREAQSGPTSAHSMSGAPEMPLAGGGKAGREP